MVDFANVQDVVGVFAATELDEDVDFVVTGDEGLITIVGIGFGEGGFGEGPFGGSSTVIISAPTTEWTNVDEP